MSVTITWLGHSAFALDVNGRSVLLDPYLTGNPLAAASADDLDAEVILLSHAHGDHLGDTIEIARRTGAIVVCNNEIGNWLLDKGVGNVAQMNPGGTYRGDFLDAKWTIAHHSSSLPDGTYGGQPNGIVIMADGLKLYYAGDTCVFMDMQLIGDMGLDLAFLPIGDTFTMGPEDSLLAIKYLRPRRVIPMHYNTFPPIMQDASEWGNRVNSETSATPIVLDPGGSYTLD
jgi:L-ascorbate metabolism protein UlaG (beta-lactamase superfamily)